MAPDHAGVEVEVGRVPLSRGIGTVSVAIRRALNRGLICCWYVP